MLHETPLSEIMNTDVVTVKVEEAFSLVWEKFRDHHIRHLPVLDDQDRVVGIITLHDFYRAYSPRQTTEGEYYDKEALDRLILKKFMTANPQTLGPKDQIAKVIRLIVEKKYGSVPIVNKHKKLVGIVTYIDILRFVSRRML